MMSSLSCFSIPDESTLKGTVVVVAKCPIPGKSKTRLIQHLGEDGAVDLAKAMLADVLQSIGRCSNIQDNPNVDKILLYAPPTSLGEQTMIDFLDDFGIAWQEWGGPWARNSASASLAAASSWTLMPATAGNGEDPIAQLTSSDLSHLLQNALEKARTRQRTTNKPGGPVVFLGMDAPEVPLDEVCSALCNNKEILLCPSADGGYGLLSIPSTITSPPASLFAGVRWSHRLTALSQIKVLTDLNLPIRLGRLMHDIDEAEDVRRLCRRLEAAEETAHAESENAPGNGHNGNHTIPFLSGDEDNDALRRPSNPRWPLQTGHCTHTRQVLKDLILFGDETLLIVPPNGDIQGYANYAL